MRLVVAFIAIWAIIFLVPFILYGSASGVLDLRPPGDSPWRFLLSVAVTKLGTAFAFVAVFALSRSQWRGHWLLYALIWFVMFVFSEGGDWLKGGTTAAEAAVGILSEAMYAPLSAFALDRMFR